MKHVMSISLKQPNSARALQCPSCTSACSDGISAEQIVCPHCNAAYPIIAGIPIMIDEQKSIFSQSDFLQPKQLFFDLSRWGKIRAFAATLLPSMGTSSSKKHFSSFEKLLFQQQSTARPRVLILGGSVLGRGMKKFANNTSIDFVHSDVSFGPKTEIVLDAHAIPYTEQSFDAVIAQAVLEHVIDPQQCVQEVWRVLKPDGLVFSATPFMQQVHGGAYDFTRFSRGGQRKLFDRFIEIQSGPSAGSGSVMAWSYQYLLLGLFGYTPLMRYLIKAFARITGFWMKYFDYMELWNPYRSDGASAIYFIGKKSDTNISDRDIVIHYSQDINTTR